MLELEEQVLSGPGLPAEEWERGRVPERRREVGDDVATAGDLVAQGICTPQCLLSNSPRCRLCACNCQGRYHGALADVGLGEVVERAARVAAREDAPRGIGR